MAKKSLKNVASKAAGEIRNLPKEYAKFRRQYKTDIQRVYGIVARGELSASEMKSAEQFIESLHQSIQDTYAIKSGERRGEYTTSLEVLQRRSDFAKEMIDSGFKEDSLRKNEMFKRDINQASVGGVSSLSREETKVFYTMTKDLWEGVDPSKRNEAIMEALGVETLEEAWRIVMNDPDAIQAVKEARKNQRDILTEGDIADGSFDEQDEKGSPTYIKNLITRRDTRKSEFNNIKKQVSEKPTNWSASNYSFGMKQR